MWTSPWARTEEDPKYPQIEQGSPSTNSGEGILSIQRSFRQVGPPSQMRASFAWLFGQTCVRNDPRGLHSLSGPRLLRGGLLRLSRRARPYDPARVAACPELPKRAADLLKQHAVGDTNRGQERNLKVFHADILDDARRGFFCPALSQFSQGPSKRVRVRGKQPHE